MSSDVEIVNGALTLIGEARIVSLDDNVKPAREAKAIYTRLRDAILAAHNWSFAMTRASLPPLADAPAFGFGKQFLLPNDCLRVILVGEIYVGISLTNYRFTPEDDFQIEGRNILTDLESPLRMRYVRRVTDTGLYPPCFDWLFSAELAYQLAEPLTNSGAKRQNADVERKKALDDAIRANAIELPPRKLPDDEWLDSRL